MVGYGIQLCIVTRFQTMAEFPWLSVAYVYAPIPVSGLFTLLFLIERVWLGTPPKDSIMYRDQATELSQRLRRVGARRSVDERHAVLRRPVGGVEGLLADDDVAQQRVDLRRVVDAAYD